MSFSCIVKCFPRLWYRRRLALALLPLLPFSWLFGLLSGLRRGLYRMGVLRSYGLSVPVIVVGNLTVGGSGKTPLVLWLVEQLRQQGWRPGIISRGYGATVAGVRSVDRDSLFAAVGDEPLLLMQRSGVPVFVGRDRVAAGQALLAAHPECNVIVSDDGLQHYRLQRTAEIAVFDGRGTGNGWLLPAGPLREPLRRLKSASAVVLNSAPAITQGDLQTVRPTFAMRLAEQSFYSLLDVQKKCVAEDLRGKRLHALAGIGDPDRFFLQLKALGLDFEPHPFPDHHAYRKEDLAFAQGGILLMTEKDAVKCAALTLQEAWVLPVDAQIVAAADGCSLLDILMERLNGRSPA